MMRPLMLTSAQPGLMTGLLVLATDHNIDDDLQTISTHSDMGTYAMLGVLGVVIILALVCSFALLRQQPKRSRK